MWLVGERGDRVLRGRLSEPIALELARALRGAACLLAGGFAMVPEARLELARPVRDPGF